MRRGILVFSRSFLQLPADLAHSGADWRWVLCGHALFVETLRGRGGARNVLCMVTRGDLQWTRHVGTSRSESDIPASQSVQRSFKPWDATARTLSTCACVALTMPTVFVSCAEDGVSVDRDPVTTGLRHWWESMLASFLEARSRGRGRQLREPALAMTSAHPTWSYPQRFLRTPFFPTTAPSPSNGRVVRPAMSPS
ncbi:uncharacterized protein B0H64DRAFT_100049 [Chaetomium fimeti]|uniref:Uncharacterized protein n=1 Tax=Chaetomium fimeti TaxID=1854472 RepID=A0AAE0HMS5_9PEZI|nr:hypothetical protein B0H64DRAFT_100049 [Chaetomium fimeti]